MIFDVCMEVGGGGVVCVCVWWVTEPTRLSMTNVVGVFGMLLPPSPPPPG